MEETATTDGEEALETVRLMGVDVHRVSVPEAVDWIVRRAEASDGRTRFVVGTGFHGLWVAQKDPDFARVLDSADLFCPDGIAPVWLSRLDGDPLPGRAPGYEVMTGVLERANRSGSSSFFLGDTEDTLARLERRVADAYPNHEVAGTLSPPFRPLSPGEEEEIVRRINRAEPDFLWVGLGLPKQERWIHRNRERLDVPVAMGVGACFRFLAGKTSRAPSWVGRWGFEWLWRLAHEPRKLWRRTLIEGPRFAVHALRWLLSGEPRASRGRASEEPANRGTETDG